MPDSHPTDLQHEFSIETHVSKPISQSMDLNVIGEHSSMMDHDMQNNQVSYYSKYL